jgi:hypothetical protein
MGQIYAAGYAYRQATSGRPNRIVLIGIWLLFMPQVVFLLVAIRQVVTGLLLAARAEEVEYVPWVAQPTGNVTNEILALILMTGVLVIYLSILWRVTDRFLRSSRNDN